ncbi:hypothetical protein D3C75_923240 [compost metagenome]
MISLILLSLFYVFTFLWSLGFIIRYRLQLSEMTGMISAMMMGTILGFGSGIILSAVLSEHFLFSIMISVIISMLAGGAIGAVISISAFLNGSTAGMMAGMMGAMLVNMVSQLQWDRLIFFSVIMGGLFQFSHTLMLQQQIQENAASIPWYYKSPALTMIVICTLIFLYSLNRQDLIPLFSMTNQHIPHIDK